MFNILLGIILAEIVVVPIGEVRKGQNGRVLYNSGRRSFLNPDSRLDVFRV